MTRRRLAIREIRAIRLIRDSNNPSLITLPQTWMGWTMTPISPASRSTGNLKYGDITEKILHAAFEAHSFLGNGFQEVVYQRALAFEMSCGGLEFARELEQQIYYKNLPEPIGTRRVDFLVEGKVLVELKAVAELQPIHWAQVLNYLKAYHLEVALLLNFGSPSLTFKRLVL